MAKCEAVSVVGFEARQCSARPRHPIAESRLEQVPGPRNGITVWAKIMRDAAENVDNRSLIVNQIFVQGLGIVHELSVKKTLSTH